MKINERGFSHIYATEYVAEAVGRCGEFVNRWLKRNGNISNDPGNRSFLERTVPLGATELVSASRRITCSVVVCFTTPASCGAEGTVLPCGYFRRNLP
jgi:hypothetical protein